MGRQPSRDRKGIFCESRDRPKHVLKNLYSGLMSLSYLEEPSVKEQNVYWSSWMTHFKYFILNDWTDEITDSFSSFFSYFGVALQRDKVSQHPESLDLCAELGIGWKSLRSRKFSPRSFNFESSDYKDYKLMINM